MAGKYLLTTLGCKVNQYESQQIREILESHGLRSVRQGETADIAVVNTCAVTAGASRKNRQAIRRVARGGTPILVVGCGATADGARLRSLPGVVAVLDHHLDLRTELRAALTHHMGAGPTRSAADATKPPTTAGTQPDATWNDVWIMAKSAMRRPAAEPSPGYPQNTITADLRVKTGGTLTGRIESFAGHQRAFLKVQDGCDAHCSYCIIPRLRPRLAYKPIEVAVAEARDLVRAGHKEIILTGIFLGAYGRETALRRHWSSRESPLADLVAALARVEGLERLRLSSLEPGDVDEALLEVLATRGACVPHLHLPLQSGSPEILRRMNRQYTRDAFIEMIDRVRAALDRPAITTDIIVGFPGEAEDDFEATLEIARHAEFCKIHAFPFSPREQTAAARWQKDFVPPPVVRERMHRLGEVERETSLSFRRRFIGEVEHVIVEEPHESDAPSSAGMRILHGRAERYFEIHFEADDVRAGDLVSVRIGRVTPTRTHGTLLRTDVNVCPLDAVPGVAPLGPGRPVVASG